VQNKRMKEEKSDGTPTHHEKKLLATKVSINLQIGSIELYHNPVCLRLFDDLIQILCHGLMPLGFNLSSN